MLVAGIGARAAVAGKPKVAETGLELVELPTSIVMAPGGRIDGPTTSARNKFRVPWAIAKDVSI